MKTTINARTAASASVAANPSSRRILVPLDLTADSRPALEYAARLAKTENASICLLHVVDQGWFKSDMADSPMFQTQGHIVSRAERHLRLLARQSLPSSTPLHIMVRAGKTTRETVKAAREICADLIVLTACPGAGLLAWLSGDPNRWIEAHVPCSVTVLREPHYGACDCSSKFGHSAPDAVPA